VEQAIKTVVARKKIKYFKVMGFKIKTFKGITKN
jgi:hypothetical protein